MLSKQLLQCSCTDPDECAAPPNKQLVIRSRSEHAWFNADEMPNVGRFQGMVGAKRWGRLVGPVQLARVPYLRTLVSFRSSKR
jgi:hypothetical protein